MKFPRLLALAALLPIFPVTAETANGETTAAETNNPAISPAPRDGGWIEKFHSKLAAAAKVEEPKIILDGDSITDWWPERGATVWERDIAPLGAINYAIAGDQTQHVLWRLEQGQGRGLKPKLVMLMIGTNNLGSNSDEQIAAGIEAIVENYRERFPDATILLQGIFPRGYAATDPARARIRNINEMISALGDTRNVLFVDFGDQFLMENGTLPKTVMPDGLHPSEEGYEVWSKAILPTISEILGKN